MKKSNFLFFTFGFILCFLICIVSIFYTSKKMQKEEQYFDLENSSLISMMLQDDTGEYKKADRTDWPTEGYNFNKTLSKCENGSRLAWQNDKVVVNTTTSDKCYIYFDLENGTDKFPYQIDSIEDLVRLSKEVADGDTKSGVLYVLTRDLDFQDPASYEDSQRTDFNEYIGNTGSDPLITGLTQEDKTGFVPIGNETNHFKGKFNGKNKKIDNLFIKGQTHGEYNALFGIIEDSEITNLQVSGTITSSLHIGGVVCDNRGTSILDGIINYVNVTGTSTSYTTGGVISRNYGTVTIKNSQNYGNISGNNDAAGILGFNSRTAVIENSNNYGQITNTLGNNVGGIVGRDGSSNSSTTINNSHNEGNVTGIRYTGGLIGYANGTVEINRNYNDGEILREDGNTSAGVGGLLGEANAAANITIKNSSNKGEISDYHTGVRSVIVGGLIGRTYAVTLIEDSYNNGIVKIDNSLRIENADYDVGGLIGATDSSEAVSIINSYNTGDTFNGNRQGGLIGNCYITKNLLLKNSFNIGKIISDIDGIGRDILIGGLVGYQRGNDGDESIIILNSYNLGDIEAKNSDKENSRRIYASGILGTSDYGASSKIINSYNIGNVKTISTNENVSNGVTFIYGSNVQNLYLNNIYNIGNVDGTDKYGMGYFADNTILDVYNSYYKTEYTASNISINATAMSETDMKKQSFVDTLNNNIVDDTTLNTSSGSITLTDIDPLLEGYTLSEWRLSEEGYPTLINE